MDLKLNSLPAVFRSLAYLYVAGICVYWFADNYAAGYTNWLMVSLFVLAIVALFLRNTIVDQVVGGVFILGGFYMILAVISAYWRWVAKGHVAQAERMCLVGGTMFVLCFLSGCALVGISIFTPVRK